MRLFLICICSVCLWANVFTRVAYAKESIGEKFFKIAPTVFLDWALTQDEFKKFTSSPVSVSAAPLIAENLIEELSYKGNDYFLNNNKIEWKVFKGGIDNFVNMRSYSFTKLKGQKIWIKVVSNIPVKIFLDGEKFEQVHQDYINRINDVGLEIDLKDGEHSLLVVPKTLDKKSKCDMKLFVEDHSNAMIKSIDDYFIQYKESEIFEQCSLLYRLTSNSAYSEVWYELVQLYWEWIKELPDVKKELRDSEKIESKILNEYLKQIRDGMIKIDEAELVELLTWLNQKFPQKIFTMCMPTSLWLYKTQLVASIVDISSQELFNKIVDTAISVQQNSDSKIGLANAFGRECEKRFLSERAKNLYEKALNLKPKKNDLRQIEQGLVNIAGAVPSFSVDLELENIFEEIKVIVSESEPNKDQMLRLDKWLERYGDRLLKQKNGLSQFNTCVRTLLNKKDNWIQSFIAYCQKSFDEQSKLMIARKKMAEAEQLIVRYGEWVNTDLTRHELMKYYMDIGEYFKSMVHASYLSAKGGAEYRVWGITYKIILEKYLDWPSEDLVEVPSHIYDRVITIAGEKMTLGVVRQHFGKKIKTEEGFDRIIYKYSQPIPNDSFRSTSYEYKDEQFYGGKRLEVEPIVGHNYVWVQYPNRLDAFNVDTGEKLFERDLGYQQHVSSVMYPKSFSPTISEHGAYMVNLKDGFPFFMEVDMKGQKIRDNYLSPDFEDWSITGGMGGHFGQYYAMLLERQRETTPRSALAKLDKNMNIEYLLPLNIAFDSYTGSQTLSNNSYSYQKHFFNNGINLYGITGRGILMKILPGANSPSWLVEIPTFRTVDKAMAIQIAPAGIVQSIGKKTIAFLPEVLEWICVDDDSGDLLWQQSSVSTRWVHSRGNSEFVVYTKEPVGQVQELVCINPENGGSIWKIPLYGNNVTGEGTIQNKKLYIPTQKGIQVVDVKNGELLDIIKAPSEILKVRYIEGKWWLFSNKELFVMGTATGIQHGEKTLEARPIAMSQTPIQQNYDSLSFSTEKNIFWWCDPQRPAQYYKTKWSKRILCERGNLLSLVQEPYLGERGFQDSQVIWENSFEKYCFNKEYICNYQENEISLRSLNDFELIWGKKSNNNFLNVDSNIGQVKNVLMDDEWLAVESDDAIRIYQLSTGELKRKIGEHEPCRLVDLKSGLLICYQSNKDKKTMAYDLTKESFGFEIDDGKIDGVKSDGQYLAILYDSKTYFYRISDGQKVYEYNYKKERWTPQNGFLQKGNKYVVEPNILISLQDKKSKQESPYEKVWLLKDGRGFVAWQNKQLIWSDGLREEKLKYPDELTKSFESLIPFEGSIDAMVIDDKLFVYHRRKGIYMFSLLDYQLIGDDRFMYFDGDREAKIRSMGDSIGYFSDDRLTWIGGYGTQLKAKSLWVTSFPGNEQSLNESIFAECMETRLLPQDCRSSLLKESSFAMRIGSNRGAQYHRYVIPKIEKMDWCLSLGINSDKGDSRASIWQWDSSWQKPRMLSRGLSFPLLKSERSRDANGNDILTLVFDQTVSKAFSGLHLNPYYDIGLEFRQSGETVGIWHIGQNFNDFSVKTPYFSDVQYDVLPESEFLKLQSFYESSNNCFPDGGQLANFMVQRRIKNDVDKNIKFLKSMLKRFSKSEMSVNILSCLLLENIAEMREKEDINTEWSEEWRNEIYARIKSLEKEALQLGIDKACVARGLSFAGMEVYMKSYHYVSQYELGVVNFNNGSVVDSSFDDVWARVDYSKPRLMIYPVGLNENFDYTEIKEVKILSRLVAMFLGGKTYWGSLEGIEKCTDEDGSPLPNYGTTDYLKKELFQRIQPFHGIRLNTLSINTNDLRGYLGVSLNKKVSPLPKFDPVSYVDAKAQLMACPTGALQLPTLFEFVLNSPESVKFKDSELVDLTIDGLLKTRSSLGRRKLINLYLDKSKNSSVVEDVVQVMKKANVIPEEMAEFLLPKVNVLNEENLFLQLGPIPVKLESEFSIAPEAIERINSRTYIMAKDKKLEFTLSKFEEDSRTKKKKYYQKESKQQALMYFVLRFKSLLQRKAFMFLGSNSRWSTTDLEIWVNRRSVFKESGLFGRYNPNFIHVPIDLDRGESQILIKATYSGWIDLQMSLGNSMNEPLNGVEWISPL